MDNIKKHSSVVILVLVLVVVVSFAIHGNKKNGTLADFGIPPLAKSDCSSLKNSNNSPVTVSFSAPNVSSMRDKVKALITKYNGQITSDSFNSYPSYPVAYKGSVSSSSTSQDSANINATFDKSQNEFLTELSEVVKNGGGVNTGYSYTDANQPQYAGAYTAYSSCASMMQSVSVDLLQLKIFTKALKESEDPGEIALISQSIATAKTTLTSDASTVNSFFATSEKPSVTISIITLQK